MRSGIKIWLVIILVIAGISTALAQKITPVDSDPDKPKQPTLHYYDKHGNPLQEPVLFLAELDTVTKVRPGPLYPLLYSANVGFNFFDGIMLLAGQKHASFDLSASLSLHNWFEPIIECGIGYADNKPEQGNFRYKNKPSFYGKIGLNYNFLYNSNPDYQVFLGLRGGFSHFKYDLTDITISSDYWGQTNNFSILNQSASAFYGQVLVGLKVKIWKWFSLGWNLRYGFMIKSPKASDSNPWFVPGYGTGALSASFSLYGTIPIHTQKKERTLPLSEPEHDVHISTGDAVAVPND